MEICRELDGGGEDSDSVFSFAATEFGNPERFGVLILGADEKYGDDPSGWWYAAERGKEDAGPGMRDGLIEPMSTTAFSGGWKVGVIACADRMQVAAANAFLKSLEEPTPKTMYLLLTDQPDAILPTIVSRTQRVDLRLPPGTLEGTEAYDQVSEALAARDVAGLAAILKDLKDEAEDDSDAQLVRKRFYRTLMGFVRKMMLGDKLPRYQAFRNIEAVEDAYRQSERSMNDEAVLSFMLDRIVFP